MKKSYAVALVTIELLVVSVCIVRVRVKITAATCSKKKDTSSSSVDASTGHNIGRRQSCNCACTVHVLERKCAQGSSMNWPVRVSCCLSLALYFPLSRYMCSSFASLAPAYFTRSFPSTWRYKCRWQMERLAFSTCSGSTMLWLWDIHLTFIRVKSPVTSILVA